MFNFISLRVQKNAIVDFQFSLVLKIVAPWLTIILPMLKSIIPSSICIEVILLHCTTSDQILIIM